MSPNIFALLLIAMSWLTCAFILLIEGEFKMAVGFGVVGTTVLVIGIAVMEIKR